MSDHAIQDARLALPTDIDRSLDVKMHMTSQQRRLGLRPTRCCVANAVTSVGCDLISDGSHAPSDSLS